MTLTGMRTKRRYAHELYPHAAEWEARPLAVEVPYLYARAIGLRTLGTGTLEAPIKEMWGRFRELDDAETVALLADALLQGMSGQDAWEYSAGVFDDCRDERVWTRAEAYGVPVDQIKPYPCGPAPTSHEHLGDAQAGGWRYVTTVAGPESECAECCEPIADDEVSQ